jgi:hypothetical protein
MKIVTLFIFVLLLLVACQPTTPSPIKAVLDTEFTLAANQTADVEGAGLSIRLMGISGDNRCPSEVECVESGFVSLVITAQKHARDPVELILETFTGNNGLAPEGPFEEIQDRVEYEGYVIQVKSILPYPVKAFDEIEDSEYRVSFLVMEK